MPVTFLQLYNGTGENIMFERIKQLARKQRPPKRRTQPPPEEDLGGGDICSLQEQPSTDDDQPLDRHKRLDPEPADSETIAMRLTVIGGEPIADHHRPDAPKRRARSAARS